MAKRARMKGKDVYVVYINSYGVSEWNVYPTRREADKQASGYRGKGTKIKKWICKIPSWGVGLPDSVRAIEFIQENYPHCAGEDR